MNNKNFDLCVIGGGPAGMMAAGRAAELGERVLLLEKNEELGRKLSICGKGRCNLTNDCDLPEFLLNVRSGGRFLQSALSRFSPTDTMAFFESRGVPLKVERGGRVFPSSDKAQDVVAALRRYLLHTRVDTVRARVEELMIKDGILHGVRTSIGEFFSPRVIIACGGCSYPKTGSTGDGYMLAQSVGHTVRPPEPSLVPLVSPYALCRDCQGLSLKNIAITVKDMSGATVYNDFGELLFTHFGLSGPVILSASAHMRPLDAGFTVYIDLKPGLDEKKLDMRLLRDFEENKNKDFANALDELLPQKIIKPLIKLSKIPENIKVNSITREMRLSFALLLKSLPIHITGSRPINEAIITSGGVTLSEINPKTMESKLLPGLYFAGEVLDLDAYTGGFNLQIAFSTGYAAGSAATSNN